MKSPTDNLPANGDADPAFRVDRWWVRFGRGIGMDRAIGFAVLTRFWQLFTGPITQLLIVFSFTSGTQDYYYSFTSMLGMQIFVELGLQIIVINLTSHEWAGLSLVRGRITGDPSALSRLISLGRMTFRWSRFVAIAFTAVVLGTGLAIFDDTAQVRAAADGSTHMVSWQFPWIVLALLNAFQLMLSPKIAILEGCHQLSIVNRMRFWQALGGTVTVWLLMVSGFGLWSLAGSAAVRLCGDLYLIRRQFREFFSSFDVLPSGPTVNWRTEVLPLQWRMAVQGPLLWFVSHMPVILILRYEPEGEAGRLAMTWTVLTALQSASMAWVETRRPLFGSLIARKEYAELDRQFWGLTLRSILLLAAGLALFCLTIGWIGARPEWLFTKISGRLLPVLPTIWFSVAFIAYQFVMCSGIYVRAHRRDPFLAINVVSCIAIASLEFYFGRKYGAEGVPIGYALGVILIQLPLTTWMWNCARREWH